MGQLGGGSGASASPATPGDAGAAAVVGVDLRAGADVERAAVALAHRAAEALPPTRGGEEAQLQDPGGSHRQPTPSRPTAGGLAREPGEHGGGRGRAAVMAELHGLSSVHLRLRRVQALLGPRRPRLWRRRQRLQLLGMGLLW